MLILLQVWYVASVVVVWVAQHPIRRRDNLVKVVSVTRGSTVFLSLAGPGDARLGEIIVGVTRRAVCRRKARESVCGNNRLSESQIMHLGGRTVEDGICNQAARVNRPVLRINSKRIAIAATKSVRGDIISLQLRGV